MQVTAPSRAIWLDSMDEGEPRVLEGALPADVAVVGGGLCGLSTAYFLKRAEPGIRVVVLEAARVGQGASGRSAGLVTTDLGLGLTATARLFGRENARQAHLYLEQGVELVERLVRRHRIDCEYERAGLLRAATSAPQARRVEQEVALAQRLGLAGVDWLDAGKARFLVPSPRLEGAWWEPRAATLNPGKLIRGLRAAVEQMGVPIFEHSPTVDMQRKLGRLFVRTGRGGVLTEKVVFATNAYSHRIPELRRMQSPARAYALLTDPLSPELMERLGGRGRPAVREARSAPLFFRLTQDNRLLAGGFEPLPGSADRFDEPPEPSTLQRLRRALEHYFPDLAPLAVAHCWSGPISVPVLPAPALGFAGSERVAYSLGCMGNGLALAVLNGWTLADLTRGERTERTQVFFVNRKVLPWPEPVRLAFCVAAHALLRADELVREHGPGQLSSLAWAPPRDGRPAAKVRPLRPRR